MQVSESEKLLTKISEECCQHNLLLTLESINQNLDRLIGRLQHCSSLSSDHLQQYYRKQQDGEEFFLLKTLDSSISSMQFYDIITQKLQHILCYNQLLCEALKPGEEEQAGRRDVFLLICPELLLLQGDTLALVRREFISKIAEMESHFTQVKAEQIPEQAIDIELTRYKTEIRLLLDELLNMVPGLKGDFVKNNEPQVLEDKREQLLKVLSLFTMSAEREVFCELFTGHPVLPLLELNTAEDHPDDEIELF